MNGQELATRFADAFENADPAALASLYAEDAGYVHPFFRVRGREQILAAETPLFDAFSEITMTIVSVTEAASTVALEWVVDATHTGALTLPDGSALAPTGRRISQPSLDVLHVDEDGLISEAYRYQDGVSFMAQLGPG